MSPAASRTHVVLMPTYNAGPIVYSTVREARSQWTPVWVIVDGSSDGTAAGLCAMAIDDPGLRVFVLERNVGKGAALLHGLVAARDAGFTHALTMDSDGQHPAALIPAFVARSIEQPQAMVLGCPVFDARAPRVRVIGRRISNSVARFETRSHGIRDSLFGFRVYPIAPLLEIMQRHRWMRRFDFDVEAVVRLAWRGVEPIDVDAPVRYPTKAEGGVSHFRYVRDNLLLAWMHARLLAEAPWRWWRMPR